MTEERITCPICDVDDTRPFIRHGVKEIVRCNQCGLVYINPRQSADTIADFYAGEYIDSKKIIKEKFDDPRAEMLKREAAFMQQYKNKGRILDVGCASGIFLTHFLDKNWHCDAIEPSRLAAEQARARGINVIEGILENIVINPSQYDLVTVIDTFFLMPYPTQDLLKIHTILKDDGVLAIEIPGFIFRKVRNVGFVSLLINRRWVNMDRKSTHLFYFSEKALINLTKKTGFTKIVALPEQSPMYGSWFTRGLSVLYYYFARFLYFISFQQINIAAKTLYLFKKEKYVQ